MIRPHYIFLVALVFIGGCQPSSNGDPESGATRGEEWLPEKHQTQTVPCTVTRIIDGDTIHCEPVGRIRLIGMDTPERGQKPFGPLATQAATELAPVGSVVNIEYDVDRTDRYNRILGYVWSGNEMVNWRLVRNGFALLATYPPNVRYVDRFVEAQTAAREDGVGLWAVDGFECTPADYRRKVCR